MDAKQFLAEFGHVANAPGGVQQLRDLILGLAFQGKLIPNLDKASFEDLEYLIIQARRNEDRVKIRDKKPIKEKLKINMLPLFWVSQALGNIGYIVNGNSISKTDREYKYTKVKNGRPFISTPDVPFDNSPLNYANGLKIPYDEEKFKVARKGAVLVCSEGGSAGKKIGISDRDICFGNKLFAIEPYGFMNPNYLYYFCRSPVFKKQFTENMTGIIGGVSLKKFGVISIPVAPTEEQVSIVAKIDELMTLCDQLENQQQKKYTLHNNLRKSSQQAAAKATNLLDFKQHWLRLQDNFAEMFFKPEDVDEFKNLVSDLALRGLFESTNELKDKNNSSEEINLPVGWSLKSLGELTEYITSGSRGWNKYYSSHGDTFIRSQDIRNDYLSFENRTYVTLPEKTEGKRTLVREGDLLLTITGGNVGKCAAVPSLDCDAYVSQHVALIRLLDSTDSEYIHSWMVNSFGGRDYLSRFIYGDKPGLNLKQIASIPIPIPPKHIRDQIVMRLKDYCSQLERLQILISKKQVLAELFATTSIANLTGINIKQEEAPLKVPQKELIAPVKLGLKKPNNKDDAPLATLLVRQNGEMNANDLWQRFGGDIDTFYAQLKVEVAHGWITEPIQASMLEKEATS